MLITNLLTGSSPGVVHRNGNPPEWEDRWEEIVAEFFEEEQGPCEPCPDVTVLTWTNRQTKSLVEQSLDRWGVPCLTLGRHLPEWRNDMKVFLNADALGRVRSTYVLALDADDVLVVSGLRSILAAFTSFDCEIVFSAEKNSWPMVPHFARFEESIAESAYCYLNSGGWIGTTDACRRFFRDCLAEDIGDILAAHPSTAVFRDDQGPTRKTFRRYHPTARLDYHCRIFQSLNQVATSGELLVGAEHRTPLDRAQTGATSGHPAQPPAP